MQSTIVNEKENNTFYTICALMECAKQMIEYITTIEGGQTSPMVRNELANVAGSYNKMIKRVTKKLSVEDQKEWFSNWDRDYQSAASILNLWAEMNDEKRDQLEKVTLQILEGKFQYVEKT